MLIKEYRIPLPLTVEEYRISQLYMIQKKSREETKGEGSGVEIIVNRPDVNEHGVHGQYTQKIYHIGNHLPGWFRAILPKSALRVEEEAFNAYPYTKTRFTCPFVEKFSVEIETKYFNDGGHQENVFDLNNAEVTERIIDFIDIVKDSVSTSEYKTEEDPTLFISQATGRGPLDDSWRDEHVASTDPMKKIMCAYKLCRVEFRYWGMQTKIERFIHDIALRKTMLRAHRQAWCWQDEYQGLTLDHIRELERQTQLALAEKMKYAGADDYNSAIDDPDNMKRNDNALPEVTVSKPQHKPPDLMLDNHSDGSSRRKGWGAGGRFSSADGTGATPGSTKSFPEYRMEAIERDSDDSSSDEEFYDAQEDVECNPSPKHLLQRWNSNELIAADAEETPQVNVVKEPVTLSASLPPQTCLAPKEDEVLTSPGFTPSCKTTLLVVVLHGGSILETGTDQAARIHPTPLLDVGSKASKKTDIQTFRTTFENVIKSHYPSLFGHFAIRWVPCPFICAKPLSMLSSLSPYSFDATTPGTDGVSVSHDYIPLGALSLLATASADYQEVVASVIQRTNQIYQEFLKSEDGAGFSGQVFLVGDATGAIIGYDALCRASSAQTGRHGSSTSIQDQQEASPTFQEEEETVKPVKQYGNHLSLSPDLACMSRQSSTSSCEVARFDFEVSDFFSFGSPLAQVLAYRKILAGEDKTVAPPKPACQQIFNLFHPADPSASRIEPLMCCKFSLIPPLNIARYQKYPLGDGQSVYLVEYIHRHAPLFISGDNNPTTPLLGPRRSSSSSISSQLSGVTDSATLSTLSEITSKWWGVKRMDYAIYCPEGLSSFPTNALPHLFHASYWESCDVVSFILRQVFGSDNSHLMNESKDGSGFAPAQPREKWLKRRTTVKIKNMHSNHRANDVLTKEEGPQIITARFMYGPLDMVSLTGEKVDVYIMTQPPTGEYELFGMEVTNSHGRVTYTIPDEKRLAHGMYPIKCVVRGDHTSVDFYLAVLPPKTEMVVFSIDGSFTASVSIMGKDPKVRAGAVDVVRHWQELGFLILYITGRPDMQQQRVVSWLAQHNFPHGMVSFCDGLSYDPLRHKTNYLRSMMHENDVVIHAAYGSSKDIQVYQGIGLRQEQIFAVGKVSKKHYQQATILSDGYAAHLSQLSAPGRSRPAMGNARMIIQKGCFGLPGQNKDKRKATAKRTVSYQTAVTVPETSTSSKLDTRSGSTKAVRPRGTSPRPKFGFRGCSETGV